MYEVIEDLGLFLPDLIARGEVDLEHLVVVEEHPAYPGELVFQVPTQEVAFYSCYRDWMSHYLVLNELFNLPGFVNQLTEDGYQTFFGSSTRHILAARERWSAPLTIEGYNLHGFQQFSLQRAFESDFWFYNWATGAGKSFCCAAGAKELFARGELDVVVFCTMASFKLDQMPFFEQAGLDVVCNDGDKTKRAKEYQKCHQVYVMNYEKLWVDKEPLTKLIADRRVLWIFDEVHKLVTAEKQNMARQAFEKMHRLTKGSRVWPMSASVVDGNPLRFRDVFNLDGKPHKNPLGPRADFERRYAAKITPRQLTSPSGKSFTIIDYEWNLSRLQEIRHRVGDRTQAVRKSDPGVREYFKSLATIITPVQRTKAEVDLVEFITDRAWEAYHREENLKPYYDMLRYVCNTPRALLHSRSEVIKDLIKEEHWDLDKMIVKAGEPKLEKLNELLTTIRDQGDKVLVFTQWTNLALHLIELDVPTVVHYGVGMTDKARQEAKDRFRSDPDITCFFSSDAGARGLNMQCARYVIQLEPTYSYDLGMQRASRIHRADSYLDGLTNYVMITQGSVEERVWDVQQGRRIISGAVQGTQELLNFSPQDLDRARLSEAQNYRWLIFGSRMD